MPRFTTLHAEANPTELRAAVYLQRARHHLAEARLDIETAAGLLDQTDELADALDRLNVLILSLSPSTPHLIDRNL